MEDVEAAGEVRTGDARGAGEPQPAPRWDGAAPPQAGAGFAAGGDERDRCGMGRLGRQPPLPRRVLVGEPYPQPDRIDVRGGEAEAFAVLDAVRHMRLAVSLGGIETLEQLAEVKRIVVEVATDTAVLNADDELCLKMADYTVVSDSAVTLMPYDSEQTETLEAVRREPKEREEEFIPRVPIVDWTELEERDLVVHKEYGIGRYLGVRTIENVLGVREYRHAPAVLRADLDHVRPV